MDSQKVKKIKTVTSEQKGGNFEIERRFLVKRIPKNLERYNKSELLSGFIVIGDEEYYRVRNSDESYSMTYKKGTGGVRVEMEMPINREMFGSLWRIIRPEYTSIKTRYYIPHDGHTIELNIYHGSLNGFVNAEIELTHEDEKIDLPGWIGPEITDNKSLTNNLGKSPNKVLTEAEHLLRRYKSK